MKPAEFRRLAGSVSAVDPAEGTGLIVSLVEQTRKWRSWKAPEAAWLASALSGAEGKAGVAARKRVVSHIGEAFLATAAEADSLSADGWRQLAGRVAGDLSES